jgi:CheY-like chemotaxis protein
MNVLIVEDNIIKKEKIVSLINEAYSESNFIFTENNIDTLKLLKSENKIDLMILDMNLPIRNGGDAIKEAGLLLLKEIIRRKDINNPRHIIGLTAYEEIREEVVSDFTEEGWIIVTYDIKRFDWELTIKNKINHILCNKIDEKHMNPKSNILFVASSPEDQSQLNAGKEQQRISEALTLSSFRDSFNLNSQPGAKLDTLSRELMKIKPEFVHFSGHGSADCLAFELEDGTTHFVPKEALELLFKACKDNIKCVFLSACYSSIQAKAISLNDIYVIGMNNSVGVDDATAFAKGFYQAIGEGKNIKTSFDIGRVHYLASCSKKDSDIPELWFKGSIL